MLKLSETDIKAILEDTRQRYPRAWGNAHRKDHDERYDYITLAAKALQAANVAAGGSAEAIGGNWRRAVVGDKSMDGLSVMSPADGKYYFEDVIVGAGGPSPSIKYRHPFNDGALLRDAGGNYAPHGYADPREWKTSHNYEAPGLPEPPKPEPPKPEPPPVIVPVPDPAVLEALRLLNTGNAFIINQLAAHRKDTEALHQQLASVSDLIAHARLEIAEARAAMDRALKVELGIPYLGHASGTVKP
jgi:hypothetical protein